MGSASSSGSVAAAPCTSDTWLYEFEPGINHGAGTGVEADLYIQRSTGGARARSPIQWDLSSSVIPTNASAVVVTNASISLYSKAATGTGTIELRHYNQDTTVEAATWNDGLKDGQGSPAAASWSFVASVGLVTIPNSAALNALIQEGIRNHASVITLILQHTADDTIGTLTARFAALEDPANQEPRLTFDWSVPADQVLQSSSRDRQRSRGRSC